MLEPQQYIDNAIAAGVSADAIQSFLDANPGDYSRIAGAMGLPAGSGDTSQTGQTYQYPQVSAPQQVVNQITGASPGVILPTTGGIVQFDPQLASNAVTMLPTDQYGSTQLSQSWLREIVGGIVGSIPGLGGIGGIIAGSGGGGGLTTGGPQIPLPGRTPPLQLPPPTIDIPPRVPRAPRAPSARTMATIAAAAAALGITVEEYIRRYGYRTAGGGSRRMNPLNPRALRRAGRRVEAFACFAKKMITFTEKTRIKGVKRGCRKRRCA